LPFKVTGSSSCELGSPPEYVVSASALLPLRDLGRLPWGFVPHRGVSPASPLSAGIPAHLGSVRSVSHALDGLLLAVPCRSISPCCHVQDSTPGVLPRPSCTTSSVAMSSRRWRRVSVAGCPTTPSHVASTSGPRSRSGSAAPLECLARAIARVPSRFSPSDSCCRPCSGDEPALHP
jgi:hypothetical protein